MRGSRSNGMGRERDCGEEVGLGQKRKPKQVGSSNPGELTDEHYLDWNVNEDKNHDRWDIGHTEAW